VEVFRRTSKNPVFQPAPTEERLFQPFLPFQTILPSWRWKIVNKGETYTPPPGLGSFEYVGGSPFLAYSVVTVRNKIVRPATDQDQKSLPAYMIYQPKQLEDKIPADLSKGGPSLKACSKLREHYSDAAQLPRNLDNGST
jgi:hypothetical protein